METLSPNIVILGAAAKNNMGVSALASGIFSSIWHTFPNAIVKLFDYSSVPEVQRVKYLGGTGCVSLINIRFSKKFLDRNHIVRLILKAFLIKIVCSPFLREKLYMNDPWLRHIYSAEYVGSIAGGDSFSDIYGFIRLIYVSLPQTLVLLMDKPLILLPQTVGPFKSWFGKKLARYILKNAKKVYSRDKQGLNEIQELKGIRGVEAEFRYDMGFVLEPSIAYERIPSWLNDIEVNRTVVGLNISGLLYIGGYSGKNMFRLKCDYRKLIQSIIDYLINRLGAHVMLVPHVLGEAENSESDVIASRKIFEETCKNNQNHLHFLKNSYDHYEIKALIGKCDFFIGSRMHACIAALSQGIPAAGLAYSPKFNGVYESVGVKELVIDLRENDENSVIDFIKHAFDNKLTTGLKLENKMAEVRSSIFSLFSNIL